MSQPTKGMNRGKEAPAPKVRRVAVNRRARAIGLSAPLWKREILDRLVQGLADVPVFLTDAQGIVTGISPALARSTTPPALTPPAPRPSRESTTKYSVVLTNRPDAHTVFDEQLAFGHCLHLRATIGVSLARISW